MSIIKIYKGPDEESKCRTCGVQQFAHRNVVMGNIYVSRSCNEWIPSNNLDYFKWLYEKTELR